MSKNRAKTILLKLTGWKLTGFFTRIVIKLLDDRAPMFLFIVAAMTYRRHQNPTLALAILDKGGRIHPPSPASLYETAENNIAVMRWHRASRNLQDIIAMDGKKTQSKVWYKLSKVLRISEKFDAAQIAGERGLELYPNDKQILSEIAKIASHKEQWESASEYWMKLITISPNSLDSRIMTSKALRMSGKTDKALEVMKKHKQAKANNNLAYQVEVAEAYTAKEDWKASLNQWQKAYQLIKDSSTPTSLAQYIRFQISLTRRLSNLENYKKDIAKKTKKQNKKFPKIVVYTSYTAGYDGLKPHEVLDSKIDYVAYTNDSSNNGFGIYDVKPLPVPLSELDGSRAIRYPKTHPHVLFRDYDVAVWLDTSLMIVGDIVPMVEEFLASNKPIGSTPHPVRNSLFEEFLACTDQGKDDFKTIKKQMDYYKRIGFNTTSLAENGLLLFNVKHPDLPSAMDTWWDMILEYSKRDQLSFGFAMDRNNIEWYRLSEPPDNVRTNPNFIIVPHNHHFETLEKLSKKL